MLRRKTNLYCFGLVNIVTASISTAKRKRFKQAMCYEPVHLRRVDDLWPTKMASSNGLASLGPDGASAAAHALSLPAEAYGNDERLEVMWAMKAYNHAEVYFNLISSVEPKFLKLTKLDDEIYSSFKETFKDLQLKCLNPDDLKSAEAKEMWRPFCNRYEDLVEDFNYGTLLRLDCEKGYTEENTLFATRIQFFAIEIARNREGFNDVVFSSRSSKS